MFMIKPFIKLIRPYQWVKNTFCLAGVVFGLHFTDQHLILSSIMCFVAFCFAASSVYVLNDICDVELDREHPKKRNRPIASGTILVRSAWVFYVLLSIVSAICAYIASPMVLIIVLTYAIMNIYYSLYGKHVVILDVFIISFGFLLRIASGTIGIHIPPSEWLILCVIMLTLFLGFAKRRSELLQCERLNSPAKLKRKVLEHYEPRMLDTFIAITASASIVSYSLFVLIGARHANVVYTVIFVIYGVFRYIYLLYSHEGGQDTANDLLDDKHLIVTIVLWLTAYLVIVMT